MKRYSIGTALLALLASVACGDRGDKGRQEAEATKEPAVGAVAEPGAAAPAPRSAADTPVGASKSDIPAARTTAPQRREVTVPQGTVIPLELETPLSSETEQLEAPVRARVRQAVVVEGVVAIPIGTTLSGVVTQVERAGRVQGRAQLAFVFNRLQADDVREDVNTAPLNYVAESTKGEDATKIGVGAIGGAIVGGILGGGSGAAKGAAIGGAAGTGVVLATRGEEVSLARGTALAASLASPLTIRIPAR